MAEPIMAWLGKGRALNYRVLQRSGKAVNCKAVNYKALKRSGEAGKGDELQRTRYAQSCLERQRQFIVTLSSGIELLCNGKRLKFMMRRNLL